jgi:hypothetical protein
MPNKEEQIDDDDDIEYGPTDTELIDFNAMQLKTTQDDDSDDEFDIYT